MIPYFSSFSENSRIYVLHQREGKQTPATVKIGRDSTRAQHKRRTGGQASTWIGVSERVADIHIESTRADVHEMDLGIHVA